MRMLYCCLRDVSDIHSKGGGCSRGFDFIMADNEDWTVSDQRTFHLVSWSYSSSHASTSLLKTPCPCFSLSTFPRNLRIKFKRNFVDAEKWKWSKQHHTRLIGYSLFNPWSAKIRCHRQLMADIRAIDNVDKCRDVKEIVWCTVWCGDCNVLSRTTCSNQKKSPSLFVLSLPNYRSSYLVSASAGGHADFSI